MRYSWTMRYAWIMTLLGIWIGLAPFAPLDLASVKLNNFVMGLLAAAVAYQLPKSKEWERWVGIIFGIWVAIASCIPHFIVGSAYLWNNFGSGTLIALAGICARAKTPIGRQPRWAPVQKETATSDS